MGSGTFYPAASGDDGTQWATSLNTGWSFLILGDYGGDVYSLFVRFPNVTIPAGASITEAYIKFTANENQSGNTVRTNIYFNDTDNAVSPTNYSEWAALSLTTAVAWDGLAAWSNGSQYDTVDIKTILQAIVNRPGWVSGQAVMAVIKDDGSDSSASRVPSPYDHAGGTEKAELHVTWVDGTVVSEPIVGSASIDGAPLLALAAPSFSAQGDISSGIYTGAWVTAEAFGLSCSVAAPAFQIGIAGPVFDVPVDLVAAPQVIFSAPGFSISGSIDAASIFTGALIYPNPFGFSGALSSSLAISVHAQLLATKTLNASILIGVAPVIFQADVAFLDPQATVIELIYPVRRFYFTLTGVSDGLSDLTIPIKSFQTRMRSGDPTYLSIVIPGIDYADQIAARSNGQLVIKMGYEVNGVSQISEEIVRVDLENTRTDRGGRNESMTLDGHKTVTHLPKAVTLSGASYRNLNQGKLRYRTDPDLYLRPGDTVSVNGDTFVADNITMAISPARETMEVSEA